MNQKLINEILTIAIAAIFLGFLLALTLKWPKLIFEPADFILMFVLSLLICCVFVGAQKIVAYKLDCDTTTKLLTFKRYWFGPIGKIRGELTFKFPLWIVMPLLFFFITVGKLKWLAILDFDIKPRSIRARKKFYALEEADMTKVAMAGIVAVLALAIISKITAIVSGIQGFGSFAAICVLFAFFALIPFGIGFKLFVSSRFIWLFLFVFSAIFFVLMQLENIIVIMIIALLFAALATIAYYSLEK